MSASRGSITSGSLVSPAPLPVPRGTVRLPHICTDLFYSKKAGRNENEIKVWNLRSVILYGKSV